MPVTKLEISARAPFAGGQSFGEMGPYEYVYGTLQFAVDPRSRVNRPIVDLDKVPAGSDGRVAFSSDFLLLKPQQPAPGGRLLYNVINRGREQALSLYNWRSPAGGVPPDLDPGDGFLMRQGFTLAYCGWQVDLPAGPGMMQMQAPVAVGQDGRPVTGPSYVQFTPVKPSKSALLSDRGHKPVSTHSLDDPNALLTVREHPDGPARTVPRSEWQFGREEDGRPVPDAGSVYLPTGFQPGMVYEVSYTSASWPVVGLSFLATRDCASFLRYGTAEQGNPSAGSLRYAYAMGHSMSGRYLRELLYFGLNEDEEGRQVFDGLHISTGSARRGEFNIRFGQPSTNVSRAPGNTFPFSYAPGTDPVTAESGSVQDATAQSGKLPKVIATNSGVEYWWSGTSLTHTDVAGKKDIDPPDNVRIYYFSGSHHMPGTLALSDRDNTGFRTGNLQNPLDYTPLMRGVLMNLDRWVREGVEPPPSRYPRIDDGTAVSREQVQEFFGTIPGVQRIKALAQRTRLDFGPDPGAPQFPPKDGEPYTLLASAVDADGNEVSGVRLPDTTVPLGTYTGWNVRHADVGGEGQQVVSGPLLGSVIPFTKTAAERAASGDPRAAIDERYGSKQEYLGKVRAAAGELARQRYVLREDVDGVVELASRRYDLLRGSAQ